MKGLIALLLCLSFITACNDQEVIIENQEELITSLILRLEPLSGGSALEFSFSDIDGDGGEEPVINSPVLPSGTEFDATLILLDESGAFAEDVTIEIQEEAEDHQVFYIAENADLDVAYLDQDADGNPIGVRTRMTTGVPGSGTLQVILRHEADKFASGVDQGLIENAGGETDIQVSFDLIIQ